ncbi:hypothetical protein V5F34_24820 [Xanthobacter autotrophicus]|uniref:hypothetical protein n=1 Tax=Xanthobacter TaxID=279 RepID=UPI001AC0D00A|nr:hypothetical protein [Hyphomicrobiales bacterium]
MIIIEEALSTKTSLQRNPFAILGATARDNRSRLIELADEVALVADGDEPEKAQSALLNIRTRLAAEMGWLPGVAPKKATAVIENLLTTAHKATGELPPLARANVLSAFAQSKSDTVTPQEAASIFYRLALAVEDIDLGDVLRDINEDRSVAGFPPVRDEDAVLEEFEARKGEYGKAINYILDRLPSRTLVKVMDAVVQKGTKEGSEHAPAFIQEIVASYEFELRGFIEAESSNVERLVKRGVALADFGEAHLIPVIEEIKKVATNFNEIVGPAQLVAKTNGIDHVATHNLAIVIRELAITLHNEHGFVDAPARIAVVLNDHFGLLDTVADQVAQDLAYLKEAEKGKKKSEAERAEFEREITYSAEIGAMFKDKVSISPDGVSWQNNRIALDAVTRLRWGGTRHSVNGIPTGTAYVIMLGDRRSSFTINTRKNDIYGNLVDRIWRAIGVRLLLEAAARLRAGEAMRFGGAIVRDDGVTLVRHKMFGSNEPVVLSWHQVNIWSQDGSFFIGSRTDKKVYVGMSYQNDDNIPVLENLIRAFFNTGKDKISEMFN